MQLRQFPQCCGMGMLYGFNSVPQTVNRQKVKDCKEAIQAYMEISKTRRYAKVTAITAGYQSIAEQALTELGWEVTYKYPNPNSINELTVWTHTTNINPLGHDDPDDDFDDPY